MELPSNNKPTGHAHKPNSSSDLFSDAKVVAEAAKGSFQHETVDTGKAADSTADLLGAGSDYGKLEEKSYGKYVEKAENYLHQYKSTHPTTTSTTSAHSSSPQQTEGGPGEYMKMAQGLLPNSTPSNETEGASGEYMKMAQGFFKKH